MVLVSLGHVLVPTNLVLLPIQDILLAVYLIGKSSDDVEFRCEEDKVLEWGRW